MRLRAHSLLVLVLAVLTAHLYAETAPEALTHLVERFSKAQQTFDVAALTELTTADYVEVSPLGEVDTRDKMLGFYAPEHKVDPPQMTISQAQARIFGDVGVVIAKVSYMTKGFDGAKHANDLRGTFVSRLTPAGWKLVSTSYTPVHPPKSK